jgi:Pyridoxamine 5'-phosphate oxidase
VNASASGLFRPRKVAMARLARLLTIPANISAGDDPVDEFTPRLRSHSTRAGTGPKTEVTRMSDREPTQVTNLDRYGNAALPWSRSRDQLVAATPRPEVTFFLCTVGPDGRPHAAGVGAAWSDGDLYFTSGPDTRKSRHLAANPAGTIAVRLENIDLVLDGEATRVTDRPTLERVVALYREGGWPAEVDGDAFTAPFSAPSAGPPPWHLYRFRFHTVVGVATAEPYGATRWRFTR